VQDAAPAQPRPSLLLKKSPFRLLDHNAQRLVDTYYGYKSNQPPIHQPVSHFEINSGSFGLKHDRRVADKAPDATASRLDITSRSPSARR